MSKPTVVVGMSGGVDSSVCAFLLKEQGYHVIGLFMKNWEDEGEHCSATEDYEDVARVCDQLNIPHFSVNFTKEYYDLVFTQFLDELKQGLTPNPDILCNREIKFNHFLKKARELGGDYLATGHYARHDQGMLYKGQDASKDQSYFLYTLKSSILDQVLFPLGALEKKEVRALAKKAGLSTAEKKDSTGICFIGKRKFGPFLSAHLPYQPGEMNTLKGKSMGTHCGLAYYTIGQRKGLGIGGEGDAWFVIGKDVKNNILLVEQGDDHPALYTQTVHADQLTWVNDQEPSLPLQCSAKVRYRQTDQPCTITAIENGIATVKFDQKQRAVTPSQAIVFYQGTCCLGGARIIPS